MHIGNTQAITTEADDCVIAAADAEAKNPEPHQDSIPAPPQAKEVIDPSQHSITYSTFKNRTDNIPRPRTCTLQEMIETFSSHPERSQKDGPAFSPAVFRKASTRQIGNVIAITMFVMDVDNGTPYEDLSPKLKDFAHLYHTSYSHKPEHHKYRVILFLIKPIPAADWRQFWRRAQQYFGVLDPATKDAARIYYLPSRPIGTQGHEALYHPGRLLSLDDLPELQAEPVPSKGSGLASASQSAEPSKNRLSQAEYAAMGIECVDELNPAAGLTAVVDRCRFMQHASAPDNQPSLSEPQWIAMMSNAVPFEGCEAWIHRASEHHPGYSEAETTTRIERFRTDGYQPFSCARIQELGFDGCPAGGCINRNGEPTKSPAGLWGYIFESNRAAHVDRTLLESYTVSPFTVSDDGIWHEVERDGKPFKTRVTTTRLDVVALGRDSDSKAWSYILNFVDHDGQRKQWSMPAVMLGNSRQQYREVLLSMGVGLCPGARPAQLLAEFLTVAKNERRVTIAHQIGWHKGRFVLPNRNIGPESCEDYVLQSDSQSMEAAFAETGSLEGWKEGVALIARGNTRLMLSIALALTGTVLQLLDGEDNIGVNLVGPSSIGKSLTLKAAASVWGSHRFVRTWNATGNGLQAVAALHNDTFLPLDEMGEADPKHIGNTVFALGNGQGRIRATQSGGQQAVRRWKLTFMSTSERSLQTTMAAHGQQVVAGQEVRLIEIPADARKGYGIFDNLGGAASPAELARQLSQATTEHYGHAGPAMIEALADPDRCPAVLERIRSLAAEFAREQGQHADAGQVSRVVSRLALVFAVGVVAIELEILPWTTEGMKAAIETCLQDWLELRGGRGELEREQAIARVREFLMRHGESRFENRQLSHAYDRKTINRAGFVEGEKPERIFFIAADVYKSEVCGGLDPKLVTKTLAERGYLVEGAEGNQHRRRFDGGRRRNFYAVRETILGMEEAETEVEIAAEPVKVSDLAKNYQI